MGPGPARPEVLTQEGKKLEPLYHIQAQASTLGNDFRRDSRFFQSSRYLDLLLRTAFFTPLDYALSLTLSLTLS